MQSSIKILIVVKQTPLFRIFKHLLTTAPQVSAVRHIKSWASLRAAINKGHVAEQYDIVIFDLSESDTAQATEKLRAAWPQTRLVLLANDRRLVAGRAAAYDAVLLKSGIVRHLLPCLRRLTRLSCPTISCTSAGSLIKAARDIERATIAPNHIYSIDAISEFQEIICPDSSLEQL